MQRRRRRGSQRGGVYMPRGALRRVRTVEWHEISITQHPTKLHKDVLTQLSTLVALSVTSPRTRDLPLLHRGW